VTEAYIGYIGVQHMMMVTSTLAIADHCKYRHLTLGLDFIHFRKTEQ